MTPGAAGIALIVGLLAAVAGAGAATITLRRLDAARGRRDPNGSVLSDVDELSRRLAEELDSKAAALDALIRDADDRLARLERSAAASELRAPSHPAHGPPRHPQPRAADLITGRVYELADRGCTPVEIAQNLGQHVGNVELILALRR